jgi:hypothetical protein
MGLADRCKRLASSKERAGIAEEAGRQVAREPEVAEAAATLHALGGGTFELRVQAKTRFGQEFTFGIPLPSE